MEQQWLDAVMELMAKLVIISYQRESEQEKEEEVT